MINVINLLIIITILCKEKLINGISKICIEMIEKKEKERKMIIFNELKI